MCKFWQISCPSSEFPVQRCDSEPIYAQLLAGFILAHKGTRRLQNDGDEEAFSKNTRFDTVCATTLKHVDRSQRRMQFANLAGLEHSSMIKHHVAEWSSSTIDQYVQVFSDYALCFGVSNPSTNRATKLEDVWNENGFVDQWIWPPEKCNASGTFDQVLRLLPSRGIFRITWMGKMQNLTMKGSHACLYSTTMNGQREATRKRVCKMPRHWCLLVCPRQKTGARVPRG